MDDAEVMHVLQAICNINQLDSELVSHAGVKCNTYELNAVHVSIPLNKLTDIPIFHPRGNHREPLLTDSHSNEG